MFVTDTDDLYHLLYSDLFVLLLMRNWLITCIERTMEQYAFVACFMLRVQYLADFLGIFVRFESLFFLVLERKIAIRTIYRFDFRFY